MSPSVPTRASLRSTRTIRLGLSVAVLLLLLGFSGLLAAPSWNGAHASTTPSAVAPSTGAAGLHAAAAGPIGGDLFVSTALTIGPSTGRADYALGGNLTVAPGGKLTIQNENLSFDEFVGNSGTITQRLDHLYTLNVEAGATLELLNSTVTTVVSQLDPYPTLSATVQGTLDLNNSILAFPGTLTVSGKSASLWGWHATIEGNPAVASLFGKSAADPLTGILYNATRFAPIINITGGAHATLLASSVVSTFDDPNPLSSFGLPTLTKGSPGTLTSVGPLGPLTLPAPAGLTNADVLTLASLFDATKAANLTIHYSAAADAQSSGSTFTDNGSAFTLPVINFSTSASAVTVPLPAAAIAQINGAATGGVAGFLESILLGDVSVTLARTNASSVSLSSLQLGFTSPASYNITVNGAGSVLTAADTSFDLNWTATNNLPGGSGLAPSNSSKLLLTNGAKAYLANVSVFVPLPVDSLNTSFVVPDGSSVAYFYRWLSVPVEGFGGLPLGGAVVTAYPQTGDAVRNATVAALDDLPTTAPALATYASALAAGDGASYGASAPSTGQASLLLADGALVQSTLPDGQYYGDYHLKVVALPSVAPQWVDSSLTPYPIDMQAAGPNASGPVVSPSASFPTFRPQLGASAVVVSNASAVVQNATIAVAESVNVRANVTNSGQSEATDFTATLGLIFGAQAAPVPLIGPRDEGALLAGAARSVSFNWTVDPIVVGDAPKGVAATFVIELDWSPGHGSSNLSSSPLSIVSPYLSFSVTPPTGTLEPLGAYSLPVELGFGGGGSATINITMIEVGNPSSGFLISSPGFSPGPATLELTLGSALQGGTYDLDISAYHDGRTAWSNSTVTVAGASSGSTSTPWYDTTVAGLPLWLLLVIVVAVIAAVLVLLMIARRSARGKLAECGECGEMIPADATSCTHCGAQFETDLVRCSRCGATVPATSTTCPECAATLLGSASAERDDPERQGYADFVERYRADAKKELGDRYSEAEFWAWWKTQSTYVPFGQWKLQQSEGARGGMTAPREVSRPSTAPKPKEPMVRRPPSGGAAAPKASPAAPSPSTPPMPESPTKEAPSTSPPAGLKSCSNCHKEIPSDYLVCPFCGAVTQ